MSSASKPREMGRRLYVDTSAYLCMLLGEEGSERLCSETEGAQLLSSVILVLETQRNLIRLARETLLLPEQYGACMDRLVEDIELFLLRDLTIDLCSSTVMPAVTTPRSLDLVHLRTALWFDSDRKIDRFMTMDSAQRQAARELGLPV